MTRASPLKSTLGCVIGFAVSFLPVLYVEGITPVLRLFPVSGDVAAAPRAGRPAFRIVAFGSSSTQGMGASSRAATYPARLGQLLNDQPDAKLGFEVINRGVAGEDIRDMLRRLQSDILARKPDLVIWQIGSNDALQKVPLQLFQDDLKAGLAAMAEAHVEVILMEPQWCPQIEDIDAGNRFLETVRQVGRETGTTIIPRFELMLDWMRSGLVNEADIIGPDHLHMTDRGYDLLAQAIATTVRNKSGRYRAAAAAATKAASPML